MTAQGASLEKPMKVYPVYLNGQFVATDRTLPVIDPATGNQFASISTVERERVAVAIRDAHTAFLTWRQVPGRDRGELLTAVAAELARRREEIARLITMENGKPLAQSQGEITLAVDHLRWFAEEARRGYGRVVPPLLDSKRHLVIKQPVGVVAAITPWNFPLMLAARKVGAALAAGCTVVLKPAEQTPLTILELARDFEALGLPPGVINIVTGDGPGAGAPLVSHPAVRKIAFTGSAEVGKLIMRSAADQLKRVSLELGGKSPNIFFSDADFENAVDGALFGTFINQVEVCSAGSRVLLQRDIYRKFVDAATAKAKTIKLGPGLDRETKMGPLVSAEQRDRVAGYLDICRREAKVAVGGGKPKQFDKGWYIEPTIFYDVDNSATIAQEEIFGPVMSVIPFNDEAEAIRIANATPYGLAAAVWTRDIFKAFRVVKALEAGIVWVNHMQPTFVEAPWGGYKSSGFGRELGHWGVEEYLETKQVFINLDEKPIGWY